jgi:hypothetical protein
VHRSAEPPKTKIHADDRESATNRAGPWRRDFRRLVVAADLHYLSHATVTFRVNTLRSTYSLGCTETETNPAAALESSSEQGAVISSTIAVSPLCGLLYWDN